MRGPWGVCQNDISDGQKDGRNRGGFLYSGRKIDFGREAVTCQLRGWEEGGVDVAVTEQRDENQEGRGRGMGGRRTSKHLRRPSRVTAADAFPNAK